MLHRMSMFQTRRRLILVLGASVVVACAQTGGEAVESIDVPARVVASDEPIGVGAWLPSGELMFHRESLGDELISVMDMATGMESSFARESSMTCNRRRLAVIDRLSDGRVSLIDRCSYEAMNGTLSAGLTINVVDVATGKVTLVDAIEHKPGAGSIAVRDDLKLTVVSTGSRICQTLAIIEDEELAPLDLRVRDGEETFNLADDLLDTTHGCEDQGVADSPDWSSDGKTLAFVASVDAIGRDGTDRLDAARGLYLWAGEAEVEPALRGLHHVGDLRWSPDGAWLAFGADISGQGAGTWLFHIERRRLVRVASDQGLTLAWSPDGRSLAMTHPAGNPATLAADLTILDVSTVVQD